MKVDAHAKQRFEGQTPILPVKNVTASMEYYVQKLGFAVRWKTPVFACVARDGCSLFLSEGDQGHSGTWVWIGVDDAEALEKEYMASGAMIRHRPTNYEWALEMQVEDPDGNVLRMGSDTKDGQPYGEWLDMERRRWVREGDKFICLED